MTTSPLRILDRLAPIAAAINALADALTEAADHITHRSNP